MPHRPRQPRAAAPRRLPSGKWQARLTYWDPDTGRRRETAAAFDKKREAEAWAEQTLARLKERPDLRPHDDTTLAEFLDRWLVVQQQRLRPSTLRRYKAAAAHARRHLGAKEMRRIAAWDLQAVYAALAEEGQSPRSVVIVHLLLHKAFADAVDWGVIPANPADRAKPPKNAVLRPWRVLSGEETRRFLAVAERDRLWALWLLLALTGMRKAEALALRWEDIDWERKALRIERSVVGEASARAAAPPKTPAGRRAVALSDFLLDALRRHREAQAAERAAAGGEWEEGGWVFTTRRGTWLGPQNVWRRFKALLRRAGLPDAVRVHDLRHGMATHWLASGVPVKVVSERLGHASVAVTLQIYAHVLPHMQAEAAETMDAALLGLPDPHEIHTSRSDGRGLADARGEADAATSAPRQGFRESAGTGGDARNGGASVS